MSVLSNNGGGILLSRASLTDADCVLLHVPLNHVVCCVQVFSITFCYIRETYEIKHMSIPLTDFISVSKI